jgi:hypothetical protein
MNPSHLPWLASELEPNRKPFPDHLPSILYGALGLALGAHVLFCFVVNFVI